MFINHSFTQNYKKLKQNTDARVVKETEKKAISSYLLKHNMNLVKLHLLRFPAKHQGFKNVQMQKTHIIG